MNSDIASVFRFRNGMVAVCDTYGKQIPDLQGEWSEKREEILKALAETMDAMSTFRIEVLK